MKLLAEVGDTRHERNMGEFIRDPGRSGIPDCAHEGYYHDPRCIELAMNMCLRWCFSAFLPSAFCLLSFCFSAFCS